MAKQTAQQLVEQYQATYQSGRANQNTEIPLALESMNQYWDSAANQKQLRYSEGLRAQTRGHEKDLLNLQNQSAERLGQIQADASKFGAQQSASASKFGAQQSAGASRYQADRQFDIAKLQSGTERYQADTSLKQTRLQTDADRYGAKLGLEGQLAGFKSNEKVTGMQQAGENFRTTLREGAETQREGMRLKTEERGQTFDLFRGLAGSPNRFAHLTSGNMRYWG